MPVFIEHLTSLVPEDHVDIEKIRNDAPEWLSTSQTIEEWLNQPGRKFFGARFNDRLLGAALVDESDNSWNLTWLCVRKVTRNRCVGQRIVSELERMAKESGYDFTVTLPAGADPKALPSYLNALITS